MGAGSLGYCLYTGSYLSYNINGNTNFVIAAGAILGVCASFLWTGQGALMLSYPTEENKGKGKPTVLPVLRPDECVISYVCAASKRLDTILVPFLAVIIIIPAHVSP